MASPEEGRAQTPLLQYFASVKPESTSSTLTSCKIPARPAQYSSLAQATKDATSKRQINKAIRNTLGKEDNPVTNSTSYGRTLHIQSCATGHQGGGGGKGWAVHRYAKLANQAADKLTETLKGVVACISGYTGPDSTNLELIECVQRQGGRIMITPNGSCTHIFSTSNLSGSKAQKYFESNKKNRYKLVLPEWAFECERAGKKIAESRFRAPIKHEAQESIFAIYGSLNSTSAASLLSTSTDSVPSTSIASTSSSTSRPPKRFRLSSIEATSAKEETAIILSPSPSPKSPVVIKKKKKKNKSDSVVKSRRKSSKRKEEEEEGKAKEVEEKKKIEEVLILGSSDVELENPVRVPPMKGSRPLKERSKRVSQGELEEEEDLDEMGMPPSAQRR